MNNNSKIVACFAVLLASMFFLSIVSIEQSHRNLIFQQLSSDAWVKQKIVEAFPDFPAVTYEEVTDTSLKIKEAIALNMARIVIMKLGWEPEYYRLFVVYQREPNPVRWDPSNHFHVGFIGSDLEVHDLGLDVVFQ